MTHLIENKLLWNNLWSPVTVIVLLLLSVFYLFQLNSKGKVFVGRKSYLWQQVFFIVVITVLMNVATSVFYLFYHDFFVIVGLVNIAALFVEYRAFNSFISILKLTPLD